MALRKGLLTSLSIPFSGSLEKSHDRNGEKVYFLNEGTHQAKKKQEEGEEEEEDDGAEEEEEEEEHTGHVLAHTKTGRLECGWKFLGGQCYQPPTVLLPP